MKKLSRLLTSLTISFLIVFLLLTPWKLPAFSGEIEDLENEIADKQDEIEENKSLLEQIEERIEEISSSSYTLSQKISLLNEEISEIEEKIDAKEKEISAKLKEIEEKEALLEEKESLLENISAELYRESRFGFYSFLFSGEGLDEIFQSLYVKKTAISILTDDIEEISGEFSNLAEAKSNLEEEQKELDAEKDTLDESYDLLVAEKRAVQAELNAQIAEKNAVQKTIGGITKEISELQNFLLIAKSGGTVVDANSLPPSTSTASLQYFNNNAPSGTFAVFSFGAYTHRNGMSQWGAWERNEQGQSYTDILSAYYPDTKIATGLVKINGKYEAIMENIKIDGYGTKSFEDYYLLGIREINPAWNNTGDMNVLKAQAIAARTYAVKRTNNGDNSICTTTACQVFSTTFLGGAWATAVAETKGMILVNSDGTPATAEYAAVHGGWTNYIGFDVKSGTGDWISRAWEAISGVTWFYRNWYDYNGSSYNACSSHKNPWLTSEEMADILNAYFYWIESGEQKDPRLVSVDVSTCWGQSADPYSMSELRALVDNPISKVTNVITTNSNGSTTSITFYTNNGNYTITDISGFKTVFNMRAPGYFSIPQSSFTHINIEVQ